MTIEIDGRRYGEDDLVQVVTGWPLAPYVFIAMDGSGVFVARREGARLSIHQADGVGVEVLAAQRGWTWLVPALVATGRRPGGDEGNP
jgi:hypothetical protein